MEKKRVRIKKYFYHKSDLGVVSITDNMNKWNALPRKTVLKHSIMNVDFTPEVRPEGDSPNIIAYKKKKGLILVED